jgi:SAM-dependent methyltransferase
MLVLAAALAAPNDPCQAQPIAPAGALSPLEADVLYVPTPHAVVRGMLRLAGVSPADVVYDLGSGDGRIPIAAARERGARAVGIELDGRMIGRLRCLAREAGVEHHVEFRHEDLFGADLRDATVVTLFLFPEINLRLAWKLRTELRPGARIVSHRFGLGDWAPDAEWEVDGHTIFVWTIPAR